MPRKHDALFEDIAGFRPLIEAAERAVRGKRAKPGAAAFMANLESEVLRLQRELQTRTYRPGRYVAFVVRDTKPRMAA